MGIHNTSALKNVLSTLQERPVHVFSFDSVNSSEFVCGREAELALSFGP